MQIGDNEAYVVYNKYYSPFAWPPGPSTGFGMRITLD